jgi:hypothetical protein
MQHAAMKLIGVWGLAVGLVAAGTAVAADAVVPGAQERWFKGNTHTHSWWSDGDSPPETIVAWYKDHGYDFLVLSDHDILSEGEKWITVKGARAEAARIYEEKFGPHWVVKRERDGNTEYRLKTLTEFRALFEEAGRFLLIQGEEISDSFEGRPVHVNGLNLHELVPRQKGATFFETIQNNINAVREQQEKWGQPMLAHLNHPNFKWSTAAEDFMRLEGDQFFEVYNGHPGVRNYGDETYVSTERMWDIVLTRRFAELDLPVMYGLATDDAHGYTSWGVGQVNPGRGWVMVKARFLTPTHIIEAMQRGDFYASTGVTLEGIRFQNDTLEIEIQPRTGVSYRTQFIGTLEGYDPTSSPVSGDAAPGVTRRYSDDIGQVLAEQEGTRARYRLTGREIYVRAKVISTAPHPNPFAEGDVEVAWTQPVQPSSRVAAAE